MGEEPSVLEEMKEGQWASVHCMREYKISEYVKKAEVKKKVSCCSLCKEFRKPVEGDKLLSGIFRSVFLKDCIDCYVEHMRQE